MTLRSRFSLGTAVLVMVLVCFAVSAASAFAAAGDSIAHAADLSPWYGSSLITSSFPAGVGPVGNFYFRAPLSAGDTLKASFTSSQLGLVANSLDPEKHSTQTDLYHAVLTFIAPSTGQFNIWVSTSYVGTFTVQPTVTHPKKYTMSSLTAPGSVKHTSSFTSSIIVKPAYSGSSAPVWLVFDRKVNGKWKLYSSHHASFSTRTSTSTKFKYSGKLPKGTFRVCAKFTDATHPKATYTSHKTITVK